MEAFICTTCGVQFAPTERPPEICPICTDERQFVPASGQGWTTLERLAKSHMTVFRDEAGLIGLGSSPAFAIGQRALLVRTPKGNVLWDCISRLDPVTIELIEGLGGLAAIAISHPHFYSSMIEWSEAFGGVPIHLHADDRSWVMRPGPAIDHWHGETKEILPGLTLIRCGGHFEGGQVLHWADGADGKGALLTGDILQVVADRQHLGFMRSYPNYIPLGPSALKRIEAALAPWQFDQIYGAWWGLIILSGGKHALSISIARHLRWIEHPAE